MSRTGGRFEGKTAFTDGEVVLSAQDFDATSGTSALTKNAVGDLSQNVGASQTVVYMLDLNQIFRKIGQLPFLQEQFGTAAGVAGPTSVANTGDPDSQIGPPPQTGNKSITPQAGFLPKGINILDLTFRYLITGAALTLHTVGISKSTFANNVALAPTAVLANAANGLQTATQANPYVTKVTVNSGFLTTDLTSYIIEYDVTTQVAGAYRLYGVDCHFQYNYN